MRTYTIRLSSPWSLLSFSCVPYWYTPFVSLNKMCVQGPVSKYSLVVSVNSEFSIFITLSYFSLARFIHVCKKKTAVLKFKMKLQKTIRMLNVNQEHYFDYNILWFTPTKHAQERIKNLVCLSSKWLMLLKIVMYFQQIRKKKRISYQ